MNLDLNVILDNITSPVAVCTPIYDKKKKKIVDFKIIYSNNELKKAVNYILEESQTYTEFEPKINSDVPWFSLALEAVEGITRKDARFYSASTKNWYKIEMKYLPEQENGWLVVTFTNVTSERKYYETLKTTLTTDSLTGFLNRSGFEDAFRIDIETTRFSKSYAALLIVDIDNLKNINDSMGAKEGDILIIRVSDVLRQFKRENTKIFRYGDDEFAVILSDFESEDSILNFTDCIYEAFSKKDLSVSGGISIYPSHSEQKDELIRFADMAVHYAKKNGKKQFVFFAPNMQRVFIQHLTLRSKMTDAILESEFKQYYQPQFDIRTGELRGFEALIRWRNESMGDISPGVFIPLAEECGLILPIGNWVLNTAISTLKDWQLKYNFKGIMSVNISPVQLRQENFINDLQDLIKKYEINPGFVEIEITEGVMIDNMNVAIEKLKTLREIGFKVSLDDFGTGYSSLSYLQMLPLNTLKIDKAFINNITASDGIQASITKAIIDMVEKMGLETIAEGVEYQEQLEVLNKFNCNIVQGYLRGKPMPYKLCDAYLSGDLDALLRN